MLSVINHSVAYGQSTIIDGMNLDVSKNEIVAVVGRNGMGKTTLMKSLVGMTPTKGGKVTLDGTDLTSLKSFQRVRAGIGFVPQGRMIFPTLTVRENIETGLAAIGEKSVPEDLYELFPVLKEMQNRRGGNLSGGQQQQLAIARALATRPKVLLLDEPTEGIQPNIIKEIAVTLRRIRDERGLSIVVSEQVLSFVMDAADRILVIEKGAIVHEENRAEADQEKIASFLAV
ncbi:urea ABC transporter ATP-binding subunit UrtE [Alcanivorax sp. 1008]|uniref:urea ABC transporter ATP-binding subunit UrtE n=1 Tax=Alcanivorax sp. 1008 TaxID=2816853 RepID=UPI001DA0206D|nr:urea ABC transporter ATP-binding subunit UrtE [Alcanivorax sp. 1008]MCC1497212.1 urea ABC transporter ATP-binding subunit UrtE [Alcanivorax sp. 1008]